MLHFMANKLNVVYISMCNWGVAGCLQQATPLLYDFGKEQDATNTKKNALVVAPKLFFVYNKLQITNSCQRMAKQHTTTLRSEAYSMNKLANVIWGDDWDVEYFLNNSTKMSFEKLIHDMYDPNPKARKTIPHVVCTLMGPPYN